MNSRIFQAFVLASLTLNVALVTTWLISPGGPLAQFEESESQWRQCDYQQQLELEDRQLRQLSALRTRFHVDQHDRCEEMTHHQQQLLELMTQPEVDDEEIDGHRQQLLEGQQQMLDLAIDRMVAEREIFDDDQRLQWFDYLADQVQCPDPMVSQATGSGDASGGGG